MEIICTSCLCAGRELSFIGDTELYNIYSQILNEISVNDMSVGVHVCWECRALLSKFQRFKQQVKKCYGRLQHALQNMSSTKLLSEPPRLQIHHATSTCYPLLMKQELDCKDEPDTLEHDLTSGRCDMFEQTQFALSECEAKDRLMSERVDMLEQDGMSEKAVKVRRRGAKKKLQIKKKRKRKVKLKDLKEIEDNSDLNDDGNVLSDTESVLESYKDVKIEDTGINEPIEAELKDDVEQATSPKCETETNGVKETDDIATVDADGKLACGECGKVFSSKKTLRLHKDVIHKKKNRHQCPRCGKVYQWKSNLGRHMRSHKAQDNGELYCSVCDKRFTSVATYKQHLSISRAHVPESEFNFKCNDCGKRFVNKTRLRDHIDWDHLNNIKFRCHLCDKAFKCHTSRYVHMKNVHRSAPGRDNLCHVCGKSYQNKNKLKYHIVAMHTSCTPYQCEHCSAAFGWYSSLYRHVREVHLKLKMPSKKTKKNKNMLEPLPPQPTGQIV